MVVTNFLCFLVGAVVGVIMTCLCNVNSREREWNELRSDMEEFELDEDLKETKEDK